MKKFLVVLLAILVVVAFAKVKITYFADNDPNGAEALLVKIFNAVHPDIQVEFIQVPWSTTDKHQMLVTRLGAKDPDPDVYLGDVIWPPEFAAAGWALKLDDYFPKSEREKYLPGVIDAVTYKGHIYAFPAFTDGGLLFYRKDLLEKYGYDHPPRTWDELVEMAQTILKGERAAGNKDLVGFVFQAAQYEGLVCDVLEYVWANGGEIIDGNGNIVSDDPKVVEAVKFVHDLIFKYKIAPESVLSFMEEDARQVFQQGKAIFMRNWPYAWSHANSPTSPVKGKVGIAPMPRGPHGSSGAATLGGWNIFVNAYSDHKKEAIEFAKWLTSKEAQLIRIIVRNNMPTRKDLYTNKVALSFNPDLEDFYKIMINAKPRPRTPIYPEVSDIMQRYFHAAVSGKMDPQKAIKEMTKELNELYEEYGLK